MLIEKVVIKNFKGFSDFSIDFNDDMNIIVGDNEVGKTTLLEAINLATTRQLNGRLIDHELNTFLFNKESVAEYITALKANANEENPPLPPSIKIELYLKKSTPTESYSDILEGTNYSIADAGLKIGIVIDISFNEVFFEEYKTFATQVKKIDLKTLPTDYYHVVWKGFSDNQLPYGRSPFKSIYVDTTTQKLQSGTDQYLRKMIDGVLDEKEKSQMSLSLKNLKEKFSNDDPAIVKINTDLKAKSSDIIEAGESIEISIDISGKGNLESQLTTYLDQVPFDLLGKGKQSRLKMLLALEKNLDGSKVMLIEEPENHLSFTRLNMLIKDIRQKMDGRQFFITTHSTFIPNRLGLTHVILLCDKKESISLRGLPEDTQKYFQTLFEYNTLRLAMAKKAILVEGPSDRLIVQKAYQQTHEERTPIEDGIDIISVRGLSFKRFLDIANLTKTKTSVITDNDGKHQTKIDSFASYTSNANISIYCDSNNALPSLEEQIVEVNDLSVLNSIFNVTRTKAELVEWMKKNKTKAGLAIFESNTPITIPNYITEAIIHAET